MQKFTFKYKNKKFNLEAKKLSFFGKFIGLMFCPRKKARALLFEFKDSGKKAFTGFFVFFPFMILWLDKENNVLDVRKIKPFEWHISTRKPYFKVLEIPFNDNYEKILHSLVVGKI